ncbi:unnamed protein product [Rotaria socialis]|uniref:Uncharacterized protein n=1 Tax=Rotaria socialis TaxID=392032 RepID=A0A818DDV0_9BILA|nr:unnamed protein product [Rotaria socialis]
MSIVKGVTYRRKHNVGSPSCDLCEWAKDHLPSEYYAMIKSTEVLDPLVPYRRAIDERKFVESLGNEWPQNYILLGDTLCTFNPQYRRGMAHACRLARE